MFRIRVLLVDDQALFLEGLRTLLDAHAEVEAVGTASNGAEAVERCAALAPDVVLMDLRMKGLDGVGATRQIRERGLPARIIALTTFDDEESVFDALRAGAVGYLLKDVGSARLVEAIVAAARGQSILEPGRPGAAPPRRRTQAESPGAIGRRPIEGAARPAVPVPRCQHRLGKQGGARGNDILMGILILRGDARVGRGVARLGSRSETARFTESRSVI